MDYEFLLKPAMALFAAGVCAILFFSGGWFHLARLYGSYARFKGVRIRPEPGIDFGWYTLNYRGSIASNLHLVIHANARNLRLRRMWPLGLIRRPLIIPWSDISIEDGNIILTAGSNPAPETVAGFDVKSLTTGIGVTYRFLKLPGCHLQMPFDIARDIASARKSTV